MYMYTCNVHNITKLLGTLDEIHLTVKKVYYFLFYFILFNTIYLLNISFVTFLYLLEQLLNLFLLWYMKRTRILEMYGSIEKARNVNFVNVIRFWPIKATGASPVKKFHSYQILVLVHNSSCIII